MFNKILKRTFTKRDKPIKIVTELFKKNFPLKLDKKDIIMQDQNLECFIPFNKIINQIKLVGMSKGFLDNLIEEKPQLEICEENFSNKILYSLEQINGFNKMNESGIKIKFRYNVNLRKINFLVNLYNIKNIVLIGVDPNRKKQKNLKIINYYRDIVIQNTVSKEQIRADIVVNRERNNLIIDNSDVFLYLISHFEYQLIPNKKSFNLIVDIEDEFNEKSEVLEYPINSINLKIETILNKVSLTEFSKNKNSDQDISLQAINLVESFHKEGKMNFEFKLIDVENFMNGNELI